MMKKCRSTTNSGFILPLSLGLLGLVSLWGSLLLEQLHTLSQHLQRARQEQLLFYRAQEYLKQCIKAPTPLMKPSMRWMECCEVEELHRFSPHTNRSRTSHPLYRFSTQHGLFYPNSQDLLSIVRLEVTQQKHRQTQYILTQSWREIFDLTWEAELNLTNSTPFIWKDLPICRHHLPIL